MKELSIALQKLRNNKPLVLCITNYVTVDFVCNALLSIGAAPIVSLEEREIEDLMKISKALYINIGTLSSKLLSLIEKALFYAKKYHVPITLDPVGSGATNLRTSFCREILPQVQIVRGNASEIISLYEDMKDSGGVESLHSVEEARDIALYLSQKHGLCVAISGKNDFITYNSHHTTLSFGCEIMTHVTGMGCSLSAIIGAFSSLSNDYFKTTHLALLYYTLCAQVAYHDNMPPASFKTRFIDTLYEQPLEKLKEIVYGK